MSSQSSSFQLNGQRKFWMRWRRKVPLVTLVLLLVPLQKFCMRSESEKASSVWDFLHHISVWVLLSFYFYFFNWATLHPFVHPTDGRSLFPLAAIPKKDPLCLANETLVQLMNHAIGLRTSQMSPLTNTMLLRHYWPSPDYSASLLTTFSFVLNTKSSHIVPLQYFNTSIMRPFRQ